MEVQKGIAITLIGTAMQVWGHNITMAAELAADVVGYSAQVVSFCLLHLTIRNVPDNTRERDRRQYRG